LDYLKRLYAKLVIDEIGVPGGAFIYDDTDMKQYGAGQSGTVVQFNGREGRKTLSQAVQALQYFGGECLGWARVDISLYLPKSWCIAGPDALADPVEASEHGKYADKRKACHIPDDVVYRAKNQIGSDMLRKAYNEGVFPAKLVLVDAFIGHDKSFIDSILKGLFYFGGVHHKDKFYLEMPTFSIPEKKRGQREDPNKRGSQCLSSKSLGDRR
jgi:hypothetical protein